MSITSTKPRILIHSNSRLPVLPDLWAVSARTTVYKTTAAPILFPNGSATVFNTVAGQSIRRDPEQSTRQQLIDCKDYLPYDRRFELKNEFDWRESHTSITMKR